MKIGLIGLGAIGTPIAHKLYKKYGNDFFLIASEDIKKLILSKETYVNGDLFDPDIRTDKDTQGKIADLLLICIKNYDLKNSVVNIAPFVNENTIILPLQNGIYSYELFRETFPDRIVLRGYMQGPNTEIVPEGFTYRNPGELHIGSDIFPDKAEKAVAAIVDSGMPAFYEKNIKKMVWKKWMLNVAGNSITALTGADYSIFKHFSDLQELCRQAMHEFLGIAEAENVELGESDIDDIINYYVTYIGSKKTSMLMDVINERKTENQYLAGTALELGKKHGLELPVISTLYRLMEIKEEVYMERNGCIAMKELFTEGIEYSDALRVQMNDVSRKMEDKEYAAVISSGGMPEQILALMKYASENTAFYAKYKDAKRIEDFPVMNKTILNENYDDVVVHSFDNIKTHKMHTSGSTGIPFTVVQDLAKRERHLADLKYFGALAGYADHDPMCYLRAKPTATPEEQERDNIWQLDICNLSAENLKNYYHVMVEKKCTALIAYPSTLETAVDFWKHAFKENTSSIKTIISTSETLTDEVKDKLKDYFGKDVGVYARYSNTEQGILGQETGISGKFRLNWASYYFEILKFDSDEKAEPGELGRIVITDLYNKAFPMIRYDTGDVAKMSVESDGDFPVFTELLGRRMDLIYDLKGEVVSPFLLCRTMRLSHGIEQWQFIQETKDTYRLKITSNTDEKPNVDKEVEGFKKTLGEGADIIVEYVEDIPVMNSLKRKLIVSNLKK